MVAVLCESVFDGLGAINEETAVATVLFLGHPLAPVVLTNEYEGESS